MPDIRIIGWAIEHRSMPLRVKGANNGDIDEHGCIGYMGVQDKGKRYVNNTHDSKDVIRDMNIPEIICCTPKRSSKGVIPHEPCCELHNHCGVIQQHFFMLFSFTYYWELHDVITSYS